MTVVAAVCIRPLWPDPQKARVVLMLGLAKTRDADELQALFYRF